MIMELYYGHGNTEYYDVKANTEEEAKEKMEVYLKAENCGSLKSCHSFDFIEPDGDVTYITEKTG